MAFAFDAIVARHQKKRASGCPGALMFLGTNVQSANSRGCPLQHTDQSLKLNRLRQVNEKSSACARSMSSDRPKPVRAKPVTHSVLATDAASVKTQSRPFQASRCQTTGNVTHFVSLRYVRYCLTRMPIPLYGISASYSTFSPTRPAQRKVESSRTHRGP